MITFLSISLHPSQRWIQITRTSRLRLVSDALVGFKRQRGLPSCKAEMAFGILSFRRRSEKLRRHDFGRLYAKKDA